MKNLKLIFILICFLSNTLIYSQVSINTDGSNPHRSAILDLKSTSQGLLFPRMTSMQIKNIWKPAAGLMVFNTDSSDFYGFNGNVWLAIWDISDTLLRMCEDSIFYSGQWYTTVQIGTQCWMAENLNVGTMIPGLTYQSNNSITEKHCYLDTPDSCIVYGGLYEWNEMMAYYTTEAAQGICPAGWHVPSATNWNTLTDFLGGSTVAGGAVKATGNRYWKSPNTGATDSSGFSAYGGGTYRPAGYNYFYLIREAGIYWTSNTNGSWAWRRNIDYSGTALDPYTCERYHSFSVRCIKN
jgi:uncharacterized protein (TIGR02145 family)